VAPDNVITTVSGLHMNLWTGTKAEYDAVTPKATDTIYLVTP
jgi:hypothetical protein